MVTTNDEGFSHGPTDKLPFVRSEAAPPRQLPTSSQLVMDRERLPRTRDRAAIIGGVVTRACEWPSKKQAIATEMMTHAHSVYRREATLQTAS